MRTCARPPTPRETSREYASSFVRIRVWYTVYTHRVNNLSCVQHKWNAASDPVCKCIESKFHDLMGSSHLCIYHISFTLFFFRLQKRHTQTHYQERRGSCHIILLNKMHPKKWKICVCVCTCKWCEYYQISLPNSSWAKRNEKHNLSHIFYTHDSRTLLVFFFCSKKYGWASSWKFAGVHNKCM